VRSCLLTLVATESYPTNDRTTNTCTISSLAVSISQVYISGVGSESSCSFLMVPDYPPLICFDVSGRDVWKSASVTAKCLWRRWITGLLS